MSGPKIILKDHYLFREGDPPDAMYVIKSGRLAVTKNKLNSEINLAELGPGAMVGEMSFFDQKPRSANVKATKDSEVIALPFVSLHKQFATFPEWAKAIMRTVNDHLRNANKRLQELERSQGKDEELFPPHSINKLISLVNLVGSKYGKTSEEGLEIPYTRLRNYTIQIFQEATHKLDKIMNCLSDLKHMRVDDLGEGRKKVVVFNQQFLYDFVEWHNDWLFKPADERAVVKEEEIKIIQGVMHFVQKTPPNDKGQIKLNITEVQNESMRELDFLIKIDDLAPLFAKKLMSEPLMEEKGLSSIVDVEAIQKLAPFWSILYAVKRITR
jgi:CRP/FNR family cyclic AMP-dependent transcriptional regulator